MTNLSLLALACGDSYGSSYEMLGLQGETFDIKKLPNIPPKSSITDDTKMATILLKHYKKYKTIKYNILLNSYKEWAKKDGYADGIGIHTNLALNDDCHSKDSQGNGALMRNIPTGVEIIQDGYSFDEAVSMINQESALTHKNKTIFITNQLALDLAVNGLRVLSKPEYKDILSILKYGNTAWVVYSLYIVIQTLKKELSFIDGFKYIVSLGGDTDTNCAVYGAIKGCHEDIRESLNIYDFLPIEILV